MDDKCAKLVETGWIGWIGYNAQELLKTNLWVFFESVYKPKKSGK